MKTTFMANPATVERKWYVVDAEGKTLGRLAAEVAKVLRGKNKPTFTPHVDTGDHVIVLNADKVVLTGKKLVQKTYFRHSGYPGGTTFTTALITLENGAHVLGESACVSPENFDEEIGRKIAYQNAVQKVWPLEGYLLKEKLFKESV